MEVEKLLKQSMEKIELSDDAELRILKNCMLAAEKKNREQTVSPGVSLLRKTASAAAAVAVCLCLSATVMATGQFGYFKDVKTWFGTVTGTKYEQATGEIRISAAAAQGQLTVLITMLTPDTLPYRGMEALGMEGFQILDSAGKKVMEGKTTEFSKIAEGRAEITIPLGDLGSGEYKLCINTLIGSQKAEQPLPIKGSWECTFTVEP